MVRSSVITGIGAYLPERVVTNHQLAETLETSDEWIRERTGIEQRHLAAEGEYTSHMAIKAARHAIASVPIGEGQTVGVVVATSTPDTTMPSVAALVQAQLGFDAGPALDVQAACTGFVYALSVAHGWLAGGLADHVVVIGAETMSRILDWTDRGTCILFGDGAGAVVLSALPETEAQGRGIKTFVLKAQGEYAPLLGTKGGTSSTQTAGHLFMHGQEVFRHGVEKMSNVASEALAKASYGLEDVTWVVPHQANARMIQKIAKKLHVPEDRMIVSVTHHANTSAASIPLALSVASADGRLKAGDLVAMPALGAGLTWGCCIAVW